MSESKIQKLIGREITFTATGAKGQITGTKRLTENGDEVTEGGHEFAVIRTIEGDGSEHCYEAGEYRLR